jgi:hypothetical protein
MSSLPSDDVGLGNSLTVGTTYFYLIRNEENTEDLIYNFTYLDKI